jgi:hypothetical protein
MGGVAEMGLREDITGLREAMGTVNARFSESEKN